MPGCVNKTPWIIHRLSAHCWPESWSRRHSFTASNRRVNELLIADRQLLRGACIPYGDLGDPDISPHWPPVKTTHQ